MLSIFSKVTNVPHQIVLKERIVRTLLTYCQNHLPDWDTAVFESRSSIVYFLQNGIGLNNAKDFLKVLSLHYATQSKCGNMSDSSKRGIDTTFLTLSAAPILTEIEAYLFPSRINDAIELARQLETTVNIPLHYKKRAWFLLLNYWNTRGELLELTKHTIEFKSLWVPPSAYESIFTGFELILKDVINLVERVVDVDGAMTNEEADWIKFHQILVRRVILRFCVDRKVHFDDRSALQISCERSALDSGILGDIANRMEVSDSAIKTKIVEILSETVREPNYPSSLIQDSCVPLIEEHHQAPDVMHKDAVCESTIAMGENVAVNLRDDPQTSPQPKDEIALGICSHNDKKVSKHVSTYVEEEIDAQSCPSESVIEVEEEEEGPAESVIEVVEDEEDIIEIENSSEDNCTETDDDETIPDDQMSSDFSKQDDTLEDSNGSNESHFHSVEVESKDKSYTATTTTYDECYFDVESNEDGSRNEGTKKQSIEDSNNESTDEDATVAYDSESIEEEKQPHSKSTTEQNAEYISNQNIVNVLRAKENSTRDSE